MDDRLPPAPPAAVSADCCREKPRSVVTVRMKRSLHQRLLELAERRKTSLNLLCVAALDSLAPPPENVACPAS